MIASRACVAMVATLALASCSLFVSLDDLSSDGGVTNEAGTSDVATTDSASDASSDAQRAPDAPFCSDLSPAPAFCDDFDEAPLGALWDSPTPQDAGTFVLDNSASLSPPNSFLVTILDPPNASDVGVGLKKTFITGATAEAADMHCEIDIRVDQNGTKGNFIALIITQSVNDPNISYSSFALVAGPDQWGVQEYEGLQDGGGFEPELFLLPAIPAGLWRHLSLDLNFKSKVATYALIDAQLDGTRSDAGVAVTPMSAPQTTFDRDISIGTLPSFAPDGTTTWQARFDNVWCSFAP